MTYGNVRSSEGSGNSSTIPFGARLLRRLRAQDDNGSDSQQPSYRTDGGSCGTTSIDVDANPNGTLCQLMQLLDHAAHGKLGAARGSLALNAEQIEALWNNIANSWPIGRIVAIDLSGTMTSPWQEHFGPYLTATSFTSNRTMIVAGAEKLLAMAWSLSAPPTPIQQRVAPEETAIWTSRTLVADCHFRRIRFVCDAPDPRHQMPVRLLPHAEPCLKAMNAMAITPVEREWLNRVARRLIRCAVNVHLFPWSSQEAAEQLASNLRLIDLT
ncbi:MAG: hypothetical protein WCK65_06495 [Rhodospirillaceae bacterium]